MSENGNGKLDALKRDRILTRLDERVGGLVTWSEKTDTKIDGLNTRLGTLETQRIFIKGWMSGALRVIGLVVLVLGAVCSSVWAVFKFIIS